MALLNTIKQLFWQWISRRAPRAERVKLRHKSIYVLPSRQGWLFLLVLLIMWLLGSNYQNNLILAIVFLLFSLMVVSILHTFRNLSGLNIEALNARPVFAGEEAEFLLRVTASHRSHHESVHISLDPRLVVAVNVKPGESHELTLTQASHRRGWMSAGRILVESSFPFGFMRAWSWIQLEMQVLVYPRPLASEEPPLGQASEGEGEQITHENPEDFYGFQPYRPGVGLSQVAWKQFARGAGLHLKEYVGYQSQHVWLDWHALGGLDTETRLSRLCYWVLQLGRTQAFYGLRLPGLTLALGQGDIHQAALLRALALYSDGGGA